jgi:tRNA U34 5-methylaminomethyl-2-thiouridine-forming methyltransferase MnmC
MFCCAELRGRGGVRMEERMASDYELVQLRNGSFSLRSAQYGETLHPGVGPSIEGDSLYVEQLRLRERVQQEGEPFVIWDVGLGAAANAIAVLRSISGRIQLISFDNTLEPLEFALSASSRLKYLQGYEDKVRQLVTERRVEHGETRWEVVVGDFPQLLKAGSLPAPHAILYDPFSPAKNPEMWTQPLFTRLYGLLSRPCALATYSRSTMVRTALLLAGFDVGRGSATGEKEETTIAANRMELLAEPLDRRWLATAERSDSAEPLWEAVYRKSALRSETLEKLKTHPQFR